MRREHERNVEVFGSHVRVLIGEPATPGTPSAQLAALEVEVLLRELHRRLTRFDPASDLCRLNSDPGASCRVSTLLALAIGSGLWAARRTDGLVDPTLAPELERAGYARSRAGMAGAPLADALAAAPPRRPAQPHPNGRWKDAAADIAAGVVRRPPGVRFDTGGAGKGLAADLCARRLAGFSTFVVDAGGDVRIGGVAGIRRPVEVDNPFRPGEPALSFSMSAGAVATSGISSRIWRTGETFAHHLLDPSTGRPAWTGVVQATALAETALEAETLAKAALLSGPERGAALLEAGGGLLVLDDGEVRTLGPLAGVPVPAAA